MTATEVDGKKVIAVQPAKSQVPDKNGTSHDFKRIVEMLLEDETTVYGCSDGDCTFTSKTSGGVAWHLGKLHPKDAKPLVPMGPVPMTEFKDDTLAEILRLARRGRLAKDSTEVRVLKARVAELEDKLAAAQTYIASFTQGRKK